MEETVKTEKDLLVSDGLQQGLILSAINFLITVVMYLVKPEMFASLWTLLIIFIVNFGFIIYSGISFRKKVGGYLTFGTAFLHCALVLFVATVIGTIVRIILFHVIDPQLVNFVTDTAIENTKNMMEGWNVPQDKIDETIDKMADDMPKQFAVSGMLISIFWPGLIYLAIFAAIGGAIAKKKKPETI
jgi:hypothetical protein